MLNLILLSSLSFLACTDGKDSGLTDSTGATDDSTGGTTDDSDTTIPEFALGGTWTDDCTYNLIIENPAAGSLFGLGMVQNGNPEGWYGEDGMTAETTHPVGATGATLASVHPDCGGGGIDDIKFGESTLLTAAMDGLNEITYVVGEVDAGGNSLGCWAWGFDVSYYPTCTDIN